MIQTNLLTLESFLYYVKKRNNLLNWLENKDNYKAELQQALRSISDPSQDDVKNILNETLNNLPELEQRVRFDLEVLENAPVHYEFHQRIPQDCANPIALQNIHDIIYYREASSIEEAIEIYRTKNCPDRF